MGEAKRVLEEAIERWNAIDRDGWAALYTDDVVYEAPGGARISGLADLLEKMARRKIDETKIGPPLGRIAAEVFARGDHRPLVDMVADRC